MNECATADTVVERPGALQPGLAPKAAAAIVPIAAATRFSLRLNAEVAARLRKLGPFPLDMPINTCSAHATMAARLGPDEWLLLGPGNEGERLTRELRCVLSGEFHSLVDISHRNVAIAVAGTHARQVLNGGCPLDLHDEAFPPGTAKRTLLGKAEIILLRPGFERAYRIECWRSLAPYVQGFLRDVAREF